MSFDKEKYNWWGFDHEAVKKRFNVNEYVGTFCVLGEYNPSAVYFSSSPDKTKGHKNYLIITKVDKELYVRGMDKKEINKWKTQSAIQCKECLDTVYSVMRHDNRFCSCKAVAIDGGRDYSRISNPEGATLGSLNLLTKKFK